MLDLKQEYIQLDYWKQSVQIEPISRRMKIYGFPEGCQEDEFVNDVKNIAKNKKCDKILFYLRESRIIPKTIKTFYNEGFIEGFFNGENALIYSVFLQPMRRHSFSYLKEQEVLNVSLKINRNNNVITIPQGYSIRWACEKDAPQMAKLYKHVFKTYPTPMDDPEFIIESMNKCVYFTVIEYEGHIVSACSADVLPQFNAAELTDCATLSAHRRKKLLSYQFIYLIDLMKQKCIKTLFSYSRAVSMGMNQVNKKHGFKYGGTLVQNSNISGCLENMNVWYKNI